jgi:GT2 family glycosyltransferase
MDKGTVLMDLSIVIVNYQHLDVLENCLQSITHFSSGFSYEIIVIDNNTTEGDVVEVTSRYSCVTLIRNDENKGFAAANNQGFSVAQGEYILMLNNDTLLFENSLKTMLDVLRSQARPVIVGCRLLNADRSMQESALEYDSLWYQFCEAVFLYKLFPASKWFNMYYHNYYTGSDPIAVGSVKGACLCAPRTVFNKLGGLDSRFYFYGEELDFCYRFKHEYGGQVLFVPFTAIVHLGGVTTDSMPWFMFRNIASAKIRYLQKHYRGAAFVCSLLLHYARLLIRVPIYFARGAFSLKPEYLIKAYYFAKQLFVYPRNQFQGK